MKINTCRGVSGPPPKCFILDVNVSPGNAPDISQLKHSCINTALYIYNFFSLPSGIIACSKSI